MAREADRQHNGTPANTIGPVERKLVELGEVRGIVGGNFGEVSEQTHTLLAALATSRVRVAGVTRGRRGLWRTEEGERSLAIAALRRRLGVLTVRCQSLSLLGRLEVLGPGAAEARRPSWRPAGGCRAGPATGRALPSSIELKLQDSWQEVERTPWRM